MSEEPAPGQDFGPYHLEQRLGGGGFGSVWRARNSKDQLVALKILTGKFGAGDTGRIRSEVEVLAAAASADSPHVVRILGGGADPAPHVVMEYIDGNNLEEVIESQGALPQRETLRILRGIAEALAVLEGAGIVHRDVKPANVMIATDGTVKLTDFGIAKIAGYESVTATGQLPLSAAYAAPEVWAGEPTAKSDLYALGAVAFQCLTGQRPFMGSFVQLYELHRSKDPELGLLPGATVPALRQVISACLAKAPDDRPQDAEAVLALLADADRQLNDHEAAPASSETFDVHTPRSLGPWLIQSPHPVQPWAFRCVHETSGESATVEVHFADNLELGEQLRRALTANARLVPLGAERLLGTNRLILRPDENWADRPAGKFMFWVARQELPDPLPPAALTADKLAQVAAAALSLQDAARAEMLETDFSPGSAKVAASGFVHVRRVGLPVPQPTTFLIWLHTLYADPDAGALLADIGDEASLRALAARADYAHRGVAEVQAEPTAVGDASTLASTIWKPTVESTVVAVPHGQDASPPVAPQPPEIERMAFALEREPQRSSARRLVIASLVGVLALGGVAMGAYALVGSSSGSQPPAQNTSAIIATPTSKATQASVALVGSQTVLAPSASPTTPPSATPTPSRQSAASSGAWNTTNGSTTSPTAIPVPPTPTPWPTATPTPWPTATPTPWPTPTRTPPPTPLPPASMTISSQDLGVWGGRFLITACTSDARGLPVAGAQILINDVMGRFDSPGPPSMDANHVTQWSGIDGCIRATLYRGGWGSHAVDAYIQGDSSVTARVFVYFPCLATVTENGGCTSNGPYS